MDNRPIGIFDSGIGGLTVLKEVTEQLPNEDIVYFGDTARIPYGTKSKETVMKYSFQCIKFLLSKNVKAIIIACNTASAMALKEALEHFDVPIIGVIEPGAKAASAKSKNGKIGVIGTTGTINSEAYQKEIRELKKSSEVIGVACPLFVQIVEDGWQDTDVARIAAEKYLLDLKEHNVDTLVLGCTHYPILRYTLTKVMGEGVSLVNPAFETAKEAKQILKQNNILSGKVDKPIHCYYVSDDPEKFRRIGGNILNRNIHEIKKVDIENL
ncbi:glutamate racemase MurI [Gottschalkia purinilytica]|uniref:Glutamate racemase n=1 Tax=Gottschalkia purinilytica TaxID=1503 RepID=A0A0L0WE79_GOTPU|nr:glutamate racemase [Gottschalkia purinilytica]KNF09774.1 glutamate racemase MurI [Gottschalkia purinilytica]